MDNIDKKYRELCSKLGNLELQRTELAQQKQSIFLEVANTVAAKAAFPKESAELHEDLCISLGDILFRLKGLDEEECQLTKELEELDKEAMKDSN